MRKLFLFIIMMFLFAYKVEASNRIEVTLSKCVDGDTALFTKDGEKIKARFLAIDTPESTNKIEEYGKEASEYTCSLLTKAKKIEIKYDSNSDMIDKYNRHLVWIFVNGELLQEKIIQKGLGEVAYLYGNYEYTDILQEAEMLAKKDKLGIWSESNEITNYTYVIVGGILLIIICIVSKKYRTKLINKTKSSIKKELKKKYKDYL